MAFRTPTFNSRAAARHSRAARMPKQVPSYTAEDGVSLVTAGATWATWYRDQFLPSDLGVLLADSLSLRTDKFSNTVRTGDLEELVELR